MIKGMSIETLRYFVAWATAVSQSAGLMESMQRALQAQPNTTAFVDAVREHCTRRKKEPDWQAADDALAWAGATDCELVPFYSALYPPLLRHIQAPPPLLYARGNVALLSAAQLAVVGSRKASSAARRFAHALSSDLVGAGFAVTSGLAIGIDAAAHRGALAAQGGTIAVLGNGIDRVYPRNHAELYESISSDGLLVSEFSLRAPPKPHHFPRRNRLISGLSLGTVVVEASERSGSMATALHAVNQGREVFAVPGDIRNPLSRGCHKLLKDGAKLTESADDVLDEIQFLPQLRGASLPVQKPEPMMSLSPDAVKLLDHCGWAPFSVEEVLSWIQCDAKRVAAQLTHLEVFGYIEATVDGRFRRAR